MTITGTCKNECPPCSAPTQVIVRDEKQTPPSLLLLGSGWPMLPVQGSAQRRSPGLVNFVAAVAYYFCLVLPAAFTQPGVHLFADLSAFRPPRASGEEVFAQRLMHAYSIHSPSTHSSPPPRSSVGPATCTYVCYALTYSFTHTDYRLT